MNTKSSTIRKANKIYHDISNFVFDIFTTIGNFLDINQVLISPIKARITPPKTVEISQISAFFTGPL